MNAAYLKASGRGRRAGADADRLRTNLEDEIADPFAHVLLLARHQGVDFPACLDRKWFVHLDAGESGNAGGDAADTGFLDIPPPVKQANRKALYLD